MAEAQYRGKCAACGEAIRPSDDIERDEDGEWVHETCADEERAEG